MSLPAHVAADIEAHLHAIAAHFKNPKITLIVRTPGLDTGDVLMTQDTLGEIMNVLGRTFVEARKPQ